MATNPVRSTVGIVVGDVRPTHGRYAIVLLLFVLCAVNYADRSSLAITGPALSKQLGLSGVALGYIFSAFGWSYVIAQIPGGWALDRFGTRRVVAYAFFIWGILALFQGFVGFLPGGVAVITLFFLRFLVGVAEAPSFPACTRIVAAWFPMAERGTASAIFNSAQYFATVLFAGLMAWITQTFGWPSVFWFMGVIGVILGSVWLKVIRSPRGHPWVNEAELAHIELGGGLVDMENAVRVKNDTGPTVPRRNRIKELLSNRMLLGIYIGQYCITTLTYFFITWFPVYLVKQRGLSILQAGFVAALPALCGFSGGILGGMFSDWMLRRGYSLTTARKTPIVIGMLTACSMIICNYVEVQWIIVGLMSLAFLGKGFGALGWAVVADTSPKEVPGLNGALFNTFGNTAAITTPIVVGYIYDATKSFNGALLYVAANALGAIACYLLVVGEIKRVQLAP